MVGDPMCRIVFRSVFEKSWEKEFSRCAPGILHPFRIAMKKGERSKEKEVTRNPLKRSSTQVYLIFSLTFIIITITTTVAAISTATAAAAALLDHNINT
ncbi:hypothetical protein L2E82_47735 [Cichorium intybus]|uniref:Uncharacterized protein n=1 Tax=Cichorium intybus TaxID=13427 RepID=A0ACB8YWT8_CICIN|nr:hypothetical protein L2E82_47735 [Cichorium intybus]